MKSVTAMFEDNERPNWVALLTNLRKNGRDDPKFIQDRINNDSLDWEQWYSPYVSGSHRMLPLGFMITRGMTRCAEFFVCEYLVPRGQHKEWCMLVNGIGRDPIECVVLRKESPVWLDIFWRCGIFNPFELFIRVAIPKEQHNRLQQIGHLVDATIALAWVCKHIPGGAWKDMAETGGERLVLTDVGDWSRQYVRRKKKE